MDAKGVAIGEGSTHGAPLGFPSDRAPGPAAAVGARRGMCYKKESWCSTAGSPRSPWRAGGAHRRGTRIGSAGDRYHGYIGRYHGYIGIADGMREHASIEVAGYSF